MKKAIYEYGLITDGDWIQIGLSRGKDSLALVDLLGRRSKSRRPKDATRSHWAIMTNIQYDYLPKK